MKKKLFLHIPKTAGSSLLSSELGGCIDKRIHSFVGTLEEQIIKMNAEDYFKFCFTRNPWDRFSSLYHYFYYMTEEHMFYKYNPSIIKLVRKYKTFEEFCLAFPGLNIKNFHFYPQTKYMLVGGRNIVDFVGKMENIDSDMAQLCEILNIAIKKPLPHSNKSKSSNYRDLYTEEMKAIVQKEYSQDIELLGYEF